MLIICCGGDEMVESMQLLLQVPGAELISSLYLQSFFFPNFMEI